jgi:hypothetical protein
MSLHSRPRDRWTWRFTTSSPLPARRPVGPRSVRPSALFGAPSDIPVASKTSHPGLSPGAFASNAKIASPLFRERKSDYFDRGCLPSERRRASRRPRTSATSHTKRGHTHERPTSAVRSAPDMRSMCEAEHPRVLSAPLGAETAPSRRRTLENRGPYFLFREQSSGGCKATVAVDPENRPPIECAACGQRPDPPTTCDGGALEDDDDEYGPVHVERRALPRAGLLPQSNRERATLLFVSRTPCVSTRHRPVARRLESPSLCRTDQGARSDTAPRRAIPSRTPGCFSLLGTSRATVARRSLDRCQHDAAASREGRTTLQPMAPAPFSPFTSA